MLLIPEFSKLAPKIPEPILVVFESACSQNHNTFPSCKQFIRNIIKNTQKENKSQLRLSPNHKFSKLGRNYPHQFEHFLRMHEFKATDPNATLCMICSWYNTEFPRIEVMDKYGILLLSRNRMKQNKGCFFVLEICINTSCIFFPCKSRPPQSELDVLI